MTKPVLRLIPVPDLDSREFWEACGRHELLIRRCAACKTFRFPPDPGCYHCGSLVSEWVRIRGDGIVFSYTIVRASGSSATRDAVPYNVAIVSLPEAGNVRMVSNLVDCREEDIRIGMPVTLVFEDVSKEVSLPRFRPSLEADT